MNNLRLCSTQKKAFWDMKIVKLPHKEIAKKTKTRMVVESLVDQFLESNLISNERLFNGILYSKEIIWIQNEGYNGHLFAKASVADELKTKKNGFTMYMPTNPIVYQVDGLEYHLITRIASVRARPNLERLYEDPKPILSPARVNDLLCSMVIRFYEIYLEDVTLLISINRDVDELLYLKKYVEREYAEFLQEIRVLNDYHFNWHPRGNGHDQLLQIIDNLKILKSKPGNFLIDISNNHGYVIVEPAYLLIEQTSRFSQVL